MIETCTIEYTDDDLISLEDEFHYDTGEPRHDVSGWIIFEVCRSEEPGYQPRNIYNVLGWNTDSSVYWIYNEIGFDYFLDGGDYPDAGIYIMEDIRGYFINDYYGESDLRWEDGGYRMLNPVESCRALAAYEADEEFTNYNNFKLEDVLKNSA
jgi:hypothetical protein